MVYLLFLEITKESPSTSVYTVILFNYRHYIVGLYSIEHNKTKMSFDTVVFFCISNTILYFLLAGQAPVSGHLSPTPLVAV